MGHIGTWIKWGSAILIGNSGLDGSPVFLLEILGERICDSLSSAHCHDHTCSTPNYAKKEDVPATELT